MNKEDFESIQKSAFELIGKFREAKPSAVMETYLKVESAKEVLEDMMDMLWSWMTEEEQGKLNKRT